MPVVAGQQRRRRQQQQQAVASKKQQQQQQSAASNYHDENIERYLSKENRQTTTTTTTATATSTTSTVTSSKLIKTLTTTKSSSNLQKCKVLNTVTTSVANVVSENKKKEQQPDQEEEEGADQKAKREENLSKFYMSYYNTRSNSSNRSTRCSWSPSSSSSPMPQLTWANSHDLWSEMKRKEFTYVHDPAYLKRHAGLEPQMRAILLDWLCEIAQAYRLHRETVHLAVEYIDRFMTLSKRVMRIDRLQLIGIAALFLAAKVEEIYPPKLKEFASHMDSYSVDNEEALAKFELFMLKTLNWEISPVTANTWLMTYLQIATINYASLIDNYRKAGSQRVNAFHDDLDWEYGHNADHAADDENEVVFKSNIVMPLNVYKNADLVINGLRREEISYDVDFYMENYMKCITLVDLCLFDVESLRFNYSALAASAIYHMLKSDPRNLNKNNKFVAYLVEKCTGYRLGELEACLKWMTPYADVCVEILTHESMSQTGKFTNVDADDWHNIQLYHPYLDLLKQAQLRKTPSKSASSGPASASNSLLLTPPDSHRKFSTSSLASSPASNSFSTLSSSLLNASESVSSSSMLVNKKKTVSPK